MKDIAGSRGLARAVVINASTPRADSPAFIGAKETFVRVTPLNLPANNGRL
jgi:hypothetical protein